jgi:hypothetical protein
MAFLLIGDLMKFLSFLLVLAAFSAGASSTTQAQILGEDGFDCDIEQTSDGDYGVRYYRGTGYFYLKRSLKTAEDAHIYCEGLVRSGTCKSCK